MVLDEGARWRERRQRGIGGSDAPVILGLSSYMSAAELWEEKTGRISPERPSSFEADLGKLLEPVVSQLAAMKLQERLELAEAPRLSARNRFRRRAGKPWQFANVDRTYEGIPVELKTAPYSGAAWGKEEDGAAGIPPGYRVQIQHQIAVMDVPKAWCAVLIAGRDVRLYEIERNEHQIEVLDAAELDFWQHVQDDVPVEADGSESGMRFLRRRHPSDDGTSLIATPEQRLLVNRLFVTQEAKKAAERDFDDVKAKIMQQMGDARVLAGPGFEISYGSYEKTVIEWKAVAATYRKIIEGAIALDSDDRDGPRGVEFEASPGGLVDLATDEKLDTIEGLYTRVDKVRGPFTPTRKEGAE